MSVSKKLLISITLVAAASFVGWRLMNAPYQVNETFFRPEIYEVTADVNGEPLPERISVGEVVPIRFRCPVPAGFDKASPMMALLQICHPSTYKGAAVVMLHQQIQGGPSVSLTTNGSAGVTNITPPFPKKGENIHQFCGVLHGTSLEIKDKIGVPLEMHLWISGPGKPPVSSGQIGEDIVWVYRHAFEFVADDPKK